MGETDQARTDDWLDDLNRQVSELKRRVAALEAAQAVTRPQEAADAAGLLSAPMPPMTARQVNTMVVEQKKNVDKASAHLLEVIKPVLERFGNRLSALEADVAMQAKEPSPDKLEALSPATENEALRAKLAGRAIIADDDAEMPEAERAQAKTNAMLHNLADTVVNLESELEDAQTLAGSFKEENETLRTSAVEQAHRDRLENEALQELRAGYKGHLIAAQEDLRAMREQHVAHLDHIEVCIKSMAVNAYNKLECVITHLCSYAGQSRWWRFWHSVPTIAVLQRVGWQEGAGAIVKALGRDALSGVEEAKAATEQDAANPSPPGEAKPSTHTV